VGRQRGENGVRQTSSPRAAGRGLAGNARPDGARAGNGRPLPLSLRHGIRSGAGPAPARRLRVRNAPALSRTMRRRRPTGTPVE
jgi:hypothetical protein